MRSLLIVCALAGAAHADFIATGDLPVTHERLLGLRIGWGEQPLRDRDLAQMSLGVVVEHHVHGALRLAGEYEYVWFGEPGDTQVNDGDGHRASLILRRHLARTRILEQMVRFWLDGELGGGMLLAGSMGDTVAKPFALAGVRIGYDLIKFKANTRASKVFEPDLSIRVYAAPHEQLGFLFGVGMSWGD